MYAFDGVVMVWHKIYKVLGLILLIGLFSVSVSAQCVQYIHINNMLDENDLSDSVIVYQNDNMSRHFINEYNYSEDVFLVSCNVTYDFYIPARGSLAEKNVLNPHWSNFMLYAFLGVLLIMVFIILLLIAYRWGYKGK